MGCYWSIAYSAVDLFERSLRLGRVGIGCIGEGEMTSALVRGIKAYLGQQTNIRKH